MMIELTKPIPELTNRELNRHIAQCAILFHECPTGEQGARDRLAIVTLADALMAESQKRGLLP